MKWENNEKVQTSVSRFRFDCWNGEQKRKSKLTATCLSLASLWIATLIGKETTLNRTLPGGEDQQPVDRVRGMSPSECQWTQVCSPAWDQGCHRSNHRVGTGWALLVLPWTHQFFLSSLSAFSFYTPPATISPMPAWITGCHAPQRTWSGEHRPEFSSTVTYISSNTLTLCSQQDPRRL